MDLALKFDAGKWELLGDAAKVRAEKEERAVLEALRTASKALGPTDVGALIGASKSTAHRRLQKLVESGSVREDEPGRYAVAEVPARDRKF